MNLFWSSIYLWTMIQFRSYSVKSCETSKDSLSWVPMNIWGDGYIYIKWTNYELSLLLPLSSTSMSSNNTEIYNGERLASSTYPLKHLIVELINWPSKIISLSQVSHSLYLALQAIDLVVIELNVVLSVNILISNDSSISLIN